MQTTVSFQAAFAIKHYYYGGSAAAPQGCDQIQMSSNLI